MDNDKLVKVLADITLAVSLMTSSISKLADRADQQARELEDLKKRLGALETRGKLRVIEGG